MNQARRRRNNEERKEKCKREVRNEVTQERRK
jgi:hypothetical protein